MLVDNAPYILLTIMTIVMVFRLVRTLRTRRHNRRVIERASSYSDGIAHGACMALTGAPLRKDYSTATCPICGKFDASKPFISYAVDCHRKDCLEP